MKFQKTELDGVYILMPEVHGDHRGWFCEAYSKKEFAEAGIGYDFVQDNHSYSAKKGVLRGLHFQINPASQAKLVRCTRGAILDVAVDIRRGSPDYKKWTAVTLSAENKKQFFIPKGFAHGFLTLTDDVEVLYKVDEYYCPECDAGIAWNDPTIGVDWWINDPILSKKDQDAPLLEVSRANFIYERSEA